VISVLPALFACGPAVSDVGPRPAPPQETATFEGFTESFDGDTLDLSKWRVAFRNWGGELNDGTSYNGGVHPDNVRLSGDGALVLEAHGAAWTGGPLGVNRDGTERPDGALVGAAIATQSYFASGRYEVRAKVAPVLGACSAIWTFHYAEAYPGDDDYPDGETAPYYVLNHEIDIESPGRPNAQHEGIGFDRALTNTWVGERAGELTTGYTEIGVAADDGAWHDYRFDWHSGGDGVTPEVVFFVDGAQVAAIRTTVPNRAGRLWLGVWFPNGWAGAPDFASASMLVDEVRFTPFHEANDAFVPESYADDGWAD
jgi:beta-glucanase (GH16 family)